MATINSTTDCPPLPEIEGIEIRHVPEFAGYAVGDDGNVWSCRPWGRTTNLYWRLLRSYVASNGYKTVSLRCDGATVRRTVPSLVCETFHGLRPQAMEVCHKDGVRTNDNAANLHWGTHSENMQDCVRHGTHKIPLHCGEKHWKAKLTNKNVAEIRLLLRDRSAGEVAAIFGVTASHIRAIRRGRTRHMDACTARRWQ